jgi:hypothetical protein
MKKLAFILALGFISNSFSQKESFISSSITKELNESRSQLNKNIFKNHPDLTLATDFWTSQYILGNTIGNPIGNTIDLEFLSKKFRINIVSVKIYPVRYLGEVVWKEQLQYIIDAETDNNLCLNDSYFYRCITVKKNKFDEYITVVTYGTKMAICHRPAYSEN